MVFREAELKGAFIIELEVAEDKRGFFSRTFCKREFAKYGLNPNIAQCNISYNKKRGTLRGMHYQVPPHQEAKLVSCIKGAIYDVIIDLRPDSATYCDWLSVELTESNNSMLYVPEGFAHGFQTLKDNSSVLYQMFEFFHPASAVGIRYDDPAFNIRWPLGDKIISDKDHNFPDFKKEARRNSG